MKISKEKIELVMATKGLSAVEVSKRAGMSRQNFSTVKLRGSCTPTTASKIAKGLGVEVPEIIEKE